MSDQIQQVMSDQPEKQQNRLEKRFRLWDHDGDGLVEREDFVAEARGILERFGARESSPKGRRLLAAYTAMWDFLAEHGELESDALTPEALYAVASEHLTDPTAPGFSEAVDPCIRAIVELCDEDDDGWVTEEEFGSWTDVIGVGRSAAAVAFKRLDEEGRGQLPVEDLVGAVRAYHLGALDVPMLGR